MSYDTDERIRNLEGTRVGPRVESNAFSDGILGIWWGIMGAGGAAMVLAVLVGGLHVTREGAAAWGSVLGWLIATAMVVIFAGIVVGATCGFVGATVARYGRGRATRAAAGVIAAALFVVGVVAAAFRGDLSILFEPQIGTAFTETVFLACGAGLVAGLNVGREVTS